MKSPPVFLLCALVVIFACSFFDWQPPVRSAIIYCQSSEINGDALNITKGLTGTPDFTSTLKWWHGAWAHASGGYFRPLTSTFWWLEYKAFGLDGSMAFYLVHRLSHLAFCVACFAAICWRCFRS